MGVVIQLKRLPGRYDPFRVDHPLPWNSCVVKAGVRVVREVL